MRKKRTSEAAVLLHNMSAPPKSVVKYEGLSGLAVRNLGGGTGITSIGYRGTQMFGQPVRFVLPAGFRNLAPLAILEQLGIGHDESRDGPADRRLRALIDACASELPLPEGCAVIPTDIAHPMPWSDPLAALAVLGKSTDTVWLRGKTTALAAAVQREAVSLLVPPAFAHLIKELP
jgi:hypothetical protein